MNVDMHWFSHLAVTTSLCYLSDGDKLELVGEWYQLECLLNDAWSLTSQLLQVAVYSESDVASLNFGAYL